MERGGRRGGFWGSGYGTVMVGYRGWWIRSGY